MSGGSGLDVWYDLHIHSCLSPCADDDMTPCDLVRMAKLKGLGLIALTDHNSCGNCAAAMAAGEREGVLVMPGMELCTREEIHVVCLFAQLAGALEFERLVRSRMPDISNRPEIFGRQIRMDEWDRPVGEEPRLLLTAADVGFDRAAALAGSYGGAAFPAHIDRPAYGAVGVLGCLPPGLGYAAAELSAACDREKFLAGRTDMAGLRLLTDSDAHSLGRISEPVHRMILPALTRRSVVEALARS